MNDAQSSAFQNAAGFSIDRLNLLNSAFIATIAFLWAAWTVVTLYRGWASGNLTFAKLSGGVIRIACGLGIFFYVVL